MWTKDGGVLIALTGLAIAIVVAAGVVVWEVFGEDSADADVYTQTCPPAPTCGPTVVAPACWTIEQEALIRTAVEEIANDPPVDPTFDVTSDEIPGGYPRVIITIIEQGGFNAARGWFEEKGIDFSLLFDSPLLVFYTSEVWQWLGENTSNN